MSSSTVGPGGGTVGPDGGAVGGAAVVWIASFDNRNAMSAALRNSKFVIVTGSLYNEQGTKITIGELIIRPKRFTIVGTNLVVPSEMRYTIPSTGDISLKLIASNTVPYYVEFDPLPADVSRPRQLKLGYFEDSWLLPNQPTVDIGQL